MQNFNYRLGLDLGTNSIGWSIYSLDDKGEVNELVDLGVRIFSDSRDPQTKMPLAVERRMARGTRRSISRRKRRRKNTFCILQEQKLFPPEKSEAQKLKSLDPYILRVAALDKKLEPFELGRALFSLSVRRGFKSNRKDKSEEESANNDKSNDKISQSQKIKNFEEEIKNSGARTLAEWLLIERNKNGGLRFSPGRMNFYPSRAMYEQEFRAIENKQKEFYPNVDWNAIYKSIFDQRPLKPQTRGACPIMSKNERTFKAMPCSQNLRILQEVKNLSFTKDNKSQIPLPDEWQTEIIKMLDEKSKVTFNQIRKALSLDDDCIFNLESINRDYLQGNSTSVLMRKPEMFGELWDKISLETQDEIVEKLFVADENSEIFALLSKYDLSEEQKENIANENFPRGTSAFCKEVSEMLVHKMKNENLSFTDAKTQLGFSEPDEETEIFETLPYYGKILTNSTIGAKIVDGETNEKMSDEMRFGKISNPTVHVALNQTRVVVNSLIKEYGKPSQIAVELGRDLKNSQKQKDALLKKQAENKKRNENDNKTISENFSIKFPNRDDRLKFRLWNEQKFGDVEISKCVYCGKPISQTVLFTSETHIDHILPFSRTLFDAESNKVLCCAACNLKKGNKTPFEAFGKSENWQEILERASNFKNPAKRKNFAENAIEKFEKDSSFIARQLTDNAYISRMALRYLKSICKDVWSVNGGMTKLLRDKWNIDEILSRKLDDNVIAHFNLDSKKIGEFRKNRQDHRHHALDASIIALIDRSLVKEISTLSARDKEYRIVPPPLPILRSELVEKVKNIVVSFKPEHGSQEKLSKETLLGKINLPKVIKISDLKPETIEKIQSENVKQEFKAEFEKNEGNIKKVIKSLEKKYPTVKILDETYVVRTPLISLNEKNISSIVDEKIRIDVQNYVEGHKGEKIDVILQKYSDEKGIKKVRCKNRFQDVLEVGKNKNKRYLCKTDFFEAIIWEIPAKSGKKPSYKASYILRTDINSDGTIKNLEKFRPAPDAKQICIVHKKDYLEFFENEKWHKCVVVGFSATDNKLVIRPIYAVNGAFDWIASTRDEMLDSCWKQTSSSQNFVSVNVLFGEKQARFITVNPIGKVFKKK